jgi:hypothetical protein
MSLSIGEIVSPLGKAEYDNDAQLKWYPHEEQNLGTTHRYIWTSQAPTGYEPSLSLLKKIRNGFSAATEPNRFVFRATYGHGKTHLALALANYFGQASGSREVENILAKVEGISTSDGQAMRRFKELHAPFLVLRLGNSMDSLPQQVLFGLEKALHEQEVTRDADLGLWFDQALGILARLDEGAKNRLDAWLGERGGAVANAETLQAKLEKRDPSVWELTRSAIQAATSVLPDFGASIDPGIAIEQACREFCGEGKPYAGLLILFDEFGAWLKDYVRYPLSQAGMPLQSMLDAVKNAKNKAVFVAFSQVDPDVIVRLERQHGIISEDLDAITKELNRLEDRYRFDMFSSMETVLDSYLKQNETAWEAMMENDHFYEAVVDASDEVERLFPERYSEASGWGADKIQPVLTKGCFPLHPLTTAILCSLKLRAVNSTRTLMGFVAEMVEKKGEQPALRNNVPNWVCATALVPAFEEMIAESDEEWAQFRQAWKDAGGEHAPMEQKQVLWAMVLHEAVNLPVGRGEGEFARNLAVLSGLDKKVVQSTLLELEALGAILHQPGRDVYTFFASGQRGGEVERWLREQVTRLNSDAAGLQAALTSILVDAEEWQPIEVKVENGHQSDWAAPVYLVPRSLFEPKTLRDLLRGIKLRRDSFEDRPRGFVLCPITTNDEDAAFYRENAARILDEALSERADVPPVVVELSHWPQPNLLNALLRRFVIANASAEDRRKHGEAFTATQSRVDAEVKKEIEAWQSGELIVPLAYRALMESRSVQGASRSRAAVLRDLYEQSYRFRPPGFFRNYKADSSKLKGAVKMACEYLAGGTMAQWGNVTRASAYGTHRELVEQFLGSGNREHWGVVNHDGRLREPTNERARKGWQVLEEAVPPGSEGVSIVPAVEKLLNAPYGYDFNTASLLFCAWFGANRHHLNIETSSRREVSIEECLNEKDAKKFLEKMCYIYELRLTRRIAPDANEVDRIVREVLMGVPGDEKAARNAKIKLELYIGDDNADPERLKVAQSALAQIENDLNLTQAYRAWFAASWERIEGVKNFGESISAWKHIQTPPALGAITLSPEPANEGNPESGNIPNGSSASRGSLDLAALRDAAREQVNRTQEVSCMAREKLTSLENYQKQKSDLHAMAQMLKDIGQSEFITRVYEAEERLDAARKAITDREADKDFVSFLKSLKGLRTLPLQTLREHLAAIDAYTPHVEETQTLMDNTRIDLQNAVDETLAFLTPLDERLANVASVGDAKRISEDIARRLDRFTGSEELAVLEAARKRLDTLDRTFDKLKDLSREKPKDAEELKKLTRAIEKLAADELLSETQQAVFQTVRSDVEARFEAVTIAASQELEKYEARNQNGDDPVVLKNDIRHDLERGLAFLADDLKPRLRKLDSAVQKRIDANQVEKIKDEFLKIKDRTQRMECLRALQALATGESSNGTSGEATTLTVATV